MKLTTILLGLLLALFFPRNTDQYHKSEQIVQIEGTIDIGFRNLYLLNYYGDTAQTIVVSPENKYSLELHSVKDGYYTLIHGKARSALYLAPGDSLNIDIKDAKLQISGRGAERNIYLENKNARENNWLFKYQRSDGKIPAHISLRNHYDELKNSVQELKDNSEFAKVELQELNYSYAKDLLLRKDGWLKSKPELATDSSFSQDLIWLNSIRTDDAISINSSKSYLSLIARILIKKGGEQAVFDTPYNLVNHPKFKAYFLEELTNNLAYLELMKGVKDYNKAKAVKSLVMKNPEFYKGRIFEILNTYDMYRQAEGTIASFSYEDNHGKTVSLEDFRGKYVYIYFWATWCAPCKREFPYLKDLQGRFNDQNIEFVGISIDQLRSIEDWKKMVAKLEVLSSNTHLSAPTQGYPEKDEITDEFAKLVHLNGYYVGIPHYMLIDPEGRVVDAFFYRPSNRKGEEYMAKLLLDNR